MATSESFCANTVDPANLKSFQRISEADMRFLKEVGASAALQRNAKSRIDKNELKALPKRPLRERIAYLMRTMIENLFFETVPANQVYSPRE